MSILKQSFFAILFGLVSTLPLGPSGISIVSTIGLKGLRKGLIALSALAIVEIIYLILALLLRSRGIFNLTNKVEIIISVIFSAFLILFGSITYKDSKSRSDAIPQGFKVIFIMSLMNPSLIISYLGLIIIMDSSASSLLNGNEVLALSTIFLTTSWLTLVSLGQIVRVKKTLIENNIYKIKLILGPLFIILGLSTLFLNFQRNI